MNAQEKINEIRTFARELAQVVGRNEMMAHVALAKIHDKVNEIAGHELAAHHLDAHGREEFANREREARAQFETFGTSEMWKIAHANRKALGDEFVDWLPRNVHVWRAFERHALTLIKRGRTHYSSKTIVHVLRHESAIAEHGGEWKINNNWARPLAQLFALAHPAHAKFFEFRDGGATAHEGVV